MNKKTVFVDTGAWFAAADKTDQYHAKASAHLKKLIKNKNPLITSNLVIHETLMLLSRKVSKNAAIKFLDYIFNDDMIEIWQADETIDQKAFSIFKKYKEHDFSIADCVSFVLMTENDIKNAFTFDKHFKTMKFLTEPTAR